MKVIPLWTKVTRKSQIFCCKAEEKFKSEAKDFYVEVLSGKEAPRIGEDKECRTKRGASPQSFVWAAVFS